MGIPFQALLEAMATQAQAMNLGIYVVGGFVRDLLRGQPNADIDIVVEGDAVAFADALQVRYGGQVRPPSQFGTTAWVIDTQVAETIGSSAQDWPPFIDIVTARSETYARAAALPSVRAGTIQQDLGRRDFTINTLALRLTPPPFGTLIDLYDGEQDLRQGVIRVLHDLSFIDDPTRIFRAVRFEQRLNFSIEPHTAALLDQALPFIENLSGTRIQHEIEMIFKEREPEQSLRRLDELGALQKIGLAPGPKLAFDEWSAQAFITARGLVTGQFAQSSAANWNCSQVSLSYVYWAISWARFDNPKAICKALELSGSLINMVEFGRRAYLLLPELDAELRPSQVDRKLAPFAHSIPTLVAAWAMTDSERVRYYLATYATVWRTIEITLNGDDLLRMGLKPGKLFGTLLTRLREAKLDGLISTPTQEREYLERLIADTNHDGKS